MTDLERAQIEMQRLVFDSRGGESLALFFKGCDPDQVKIYRDLSRNSFQSTLDTLFEVTRSYFIATDRLDDWKNLGNGFIDHNPPKDFRINWTGAGFSEFLEGKVAPWLRELAKYEWLYFLAASGSPQLQSFDFPVPQWFQKNGPAFETLTEEHFALLGESAKKTTVAIFQDPATFEVRCLEVTESPTTSGK